MSKKSTSVLAVYVILFVLYNVIFWVIPIDKSAAQIVMYVFTLAAIAASYGITRIAFDKGENFKSKLYGFPIFRVGILYAAVQIIAGAVVSVIDLAMTDGEFPVWISVVVSLIIGAFAAVGVIAADNARDVIEEQEVIQHRDIKAVTTFRINMEDIVDVCSDAEVKKQLSRLAEDFRYSDPVSSDEIADIEGRISAEIENLRGMVSDGADGVIEKISEIKNLLESRNRQCKAMKR